ncbi:MAG: hypothetical protein EOO06_16845 [Chitinophagaceae bacterium]|nr:MAG: hypothetical protein EOO06_16845 [Chitinophagaceae bacterium]
MSCVETQECPVCYEDLEITELITNYKCDHKTCRPCSTKLSLRSGVRNECPMCRAASRSGPDTFKLDIRLKMSNGKTRSYSTQRNFMRLLMIMMPSMRSTKYATNVS